MKVISQRTLANGRRRMTIELDVTEGTLIAVDSRFHYQLGHPMADVVAPEILSEVREVRWCSVEQRWIS